MNAGNIDLSALLKLADKVIDSYGSEDFLNNLEEYSQTFENWFAVNGDSIQNGKSQWTRAELDVLVQKHEAIVNQTSSEQSAIPDEIRKLKIKGRGILAYTDLLPKKISLSKPRKG